LSLHLRPPRRRRPLTHERDAGLIVRPAARPSGSQRRCVAGLEQLEVEVDGDHVADEGGRDGLAQPEVAAPQPAGGLEAGVARTAGEGTLTDAAIFNAAVEEIIDGLLQDAHDRGETLTREQAAYDALIEMANRINTTDWTDLDEVPDDDIDEPDPVDNEDQDDGADVVVEPHGGDTGVRVDRNPMKATRKRPRRKAQPYLGIVRAELPALRRGYPIGDEVVEIAGLGPISVPEAREILGGDAVLQLVLTNGVNANVTNLRRQPNTAQRMALLAQMPCCSVKGCARTWVQLDHRKDWAATHVTRLEDLDPLCWWHHQQKTLHGWALVDGAGKRAFVPPTDPRHPDNTRTRPAADGNNDSHTHGPTASDAADAQASRSPATDTRTCVSVATDTADTRSPGSATTDSRTCGPAVTSGDTTSGPVATGAMDASASVPAPRDDTAAGDVGPDSADCDLQRTSPPQRGLVAV
jgi:hypothetical protein